MVDEPEQLGSGLLIDFATAASPGPVNPQPANHNRFVPAVSFERKELQTILDLYGRKVVDGAQLAAFASAHAASAPPDPTGIGSSARNRFAGLVTNVISDTVMSQVEMQCGPFTVVSLMSTQAVRELQLQPGSIAVAVVKATTVIVETPKGQS